MKPRRFIAALIGLMFAAGAALASDDCPRAPREQWKPQAEAHAATDALGYQVTSVKIDDGCYEVKATDKSGKRVELKFNPTDLQLVSRKFKSERAVVSR